MYHHFRPLWDSRLAAEIMPAGSKTTVVSNAHSSAREGEKMNEGMTIPLVLAWLQSGWSLDGNVQIYNLKTHSLYIRKHFWTNCNWFFRFGYFIDYGPTKYNLFAIGSTCHFKSTMRVKSIRLYLSNCTIYIIYNYTITFKSTNNSKSIHMCFCL